MTPDFRSEQQPAMKLSRRAFTLGGAAILANPIDHQLKRERRTVQLTGWGP
jgi:hypothetical protein